MEFRTAAVAFWTILSSSAATASGRWVKVAQPRPYNPGSPVYALAEPTSWGEMFAQVPDAFVVAGAAVVVASVLYLLWLEMKHR